MVRARCKLLPSADDRFVVMWVDDGASGERYRLAVTLVVGCGRSSSLLVVSYWSTRKYSAWVFRDSQALYGATDSYGKDGQNTIRHTCHMEENSTDLLQGLIVDNPDLERLEDLIAEFNLFDVLGIATREVRHSAFLAWLLNPAANHGLGDFFLRRFLMRVTSVGNALGTTELTAVDVDGWQLGDVDVVTERHNIDILIISETDGFVCAIENKLFSGEHSNQLHRYREIVDREYAHQRSLFVLLSIDGQVASNDDDAEVYVPASYEFVANLVNRVLEARGSGLGADVRSALTQYLSTLRRHVLSDSEIQELARRIYRNHKAAIDLIIEAKPDALQEVREMVEEQIALHSEIALDSASKSYIQFYDPRWDKHEELVNGSGFGSSGRILLFQFQNSPNSLNLNLIIGPGPAEIRGRLFDEAVKTSGIFKPPRKVLPKTWATIYRKSVLRKGDYEMDDHEVARSKISRILGSLLKDDLDPIRDLVERSLA